MANPPPHPTNNEPPPFLGSWRNMYVAVIALLVITMIAVYIFSRLFS